MIKGCIFDLDGTLIDSLEDLANSTNEVLCNHGFLTHELDKYNYFIGNGVKKLVYRSLPDDKKELVDECLKEFYEVYERRCLECTYCFDGIVELLEYLKSIGIYMAVVTNKPDYLAKKICNHYFKDMFIDVIGNREDFPLKPDPSSTLSVLGQFGIKNDECLFIGDSNVDIYTGINASMKTIGVTWGFRTYEELTEAGSTYVVNHVDEIKEIIDESRN